MKTRYGQAGCIERKVEHFETPTAKPRVGATENPPCELIANDERRAISKSGGCQRQRRSVLKLEAGARVG